MVEKKRKRKEKRNKQKLETHKNKNNFDSYSSACPRISRGLSRPGVQENVPMKYVCTSCYGGLWGPGWLQAPQGLWT